MEGLGMEGQVDVRSGEGQSPSEGNVELLRLRSFSDPRLGIAERFLTPTIGGGRTVAVLSTPLGAPREAGWVFCHAFAMDQVNLQPFEVPLARRVSAAGFPVLRFHAQGFGDSELPTSHISVDSQIGDAVEAVQLLREVAGVRRVGLFGARFGGAVAAIAAERTGADALALWDPVVSGRRYATRLARMSSASELVTKGRAQVQGQNPMEVLKETGLLDVQGVPVTRELFDAISRVDLKGALRDFEGRSVVVQVSRSPGPRGDLENFVAHLSGLGQQSQLEVIVDHQADKFGQPRLIGNGDGTKSDTMSTMASSLIGSTAIWCEELLGDRT